MKKVLLLMLVAAMFSMAACGNATGVPVESNVKDVSKGIYIEPNAEDVTDVLKWQYIDYCLEHFKENPEDLAEFYVVLYGGTPHKEDGTPITTAEAISILAAEIRADEELAQKYQEEAKQIMDWIIPWYDKWDRTLNGGASTPEEAYHKMMTYLSKITETEPLPIRTETLALMSKVFPAGASRWTN